jgi:hypothetical protein
MPRFVAIMLLAELGACQPAFVNGVPNENSPYFEVPVDTRLLLRGAIDVPARADSAYFQRGQTLPWYDVNIYGTWCVLKLAGKRDVPRTIQADEFAVRKVSSERRYYLGAAPGMRLVATDFDRDNGESYEVMATVMHLHSPRQPDVSQLVCADWGLPQGGSYLTIHKIRRTLGDFFRLELPPR